MYYQNYDDYMRDVFYFNQMPNQNIGYPNMGYNMQNPNLAFNNPNVNMNSNFSNGNQNYNNMYPNYNNMYPDIYRIIQPVVSRVVTGNNYQYINDDNLNSMVDTVYNIIEGENMSTNSENKNNTTTSTTTNQRTNSNSQNNTQNTGNSNSQVSDPSNNNQNSSNLLKDLIKILIIKEIINRNNLRRMSNNSMYGYQNIPNYYEQRYMF